jgi:hypothetical protein
MPKNDATPDGRSQHFTFPRRELLHKVASAALQCLGLHKLFVVVPLKGRPLPEFNIGDLVATHWTGEFDEDFIDFGEIVGMCYLPVESQYYPYHVWVYYVYWTHSTCGDDWGYPNFCQDPVEATELRSVNHV